MSAADHPQVRALAALYRPPDTQERQRPREAGESNNIRLGGRAQHTTTGPVAMLLDRLERVRRAGRGWSARCPAHEDRTASLSVAEGGDGRCLVHCFAGCAVADVLGAIGLSMGDLFPERIAPQTPAERAQARQWARDANWSAAIGVLSVEATVCEVAMTMIERGEPLSGDDIERVRIAAGRIHAAREVLA